MWRGLGITMAAGHYVFLAYLLAGGFLAWRWRWSIVPHVLAAVWATLILTTRVPCPLTALQNNFRERAGQRPISGGFIEHYVRGVLYPAAYEHEAQALLGLVVLASWIGFVRRRGRRSNVSSDAAGRPAASPRQ
ncbi:MAG TPA: DUF2784 domain-containing protein [Jatrophihabitans sp.]|uniref:DUF2784 domain-containing protein n=1 Tax=Jatrophihabitans sp. TaxID=1932789 RepID=UPI002DFFC244|nr:DUF2784 domain-containing protein [Jatrophihabitans sp.]